MVIAQPYGLSVVIFVVELYLIRVGIALCPLLEQTPLAVLERILQKMERFGNAVNAY